MSEENVEVLRAAIDAVNRGDIESAIELIDPDVVWEPMRAPMAGAYRGHAGMREWWADTQETFDSFRVDPTDLRALGDDRILAIGRLHVRGRGSGLETDVPTGGIATVRKGLIVGWKDYGDRAKALEAAGLGEEAGPQLNWT